MEQASAMLPSPPQNWDKATNKWIFFFLYLFGGASFYSTLPNIYFVVFVIYGNSIFMIVVCVHITRTTAMCGICVIYNILFFLYVCV